MHIPLNKWTFDSHGNFDSTRVDQSINNFQTMIYPITIPIQSKMKFSDYDKSNDDESNNNSIT